MTGGLYYGGTFGFPTPIGGVGGGFYVDNYGNIYPQFYYGAPRFSGSTGYTPDIEGLLTGPSVSATIGGKSVGYNFGRSGDATGVGFGTPGVGATCGFGPFNISDMGDSFRPRTDEYGQPFPENGTADTPPIAPDFPGVKDRSLDAKLLGLHDTKG